MIANIIANTLLARGAKKVASKSSDFVAPEMGAADNGDFNGVTNPYREQLENGSYKLSFWDKLGNKLGFNTKEDSYRIELERLAREFDSNLQIQDAVNAYNSETAQAQRLRQAGINPDLNGVSSEGATSATPSAPDSSGLSGIEGLTTFQEVQPVMSTISSIINTALGDVAGLFGMFQNINSRKLGNDAQLLTNIQSAYNFGNKTSELGFKESDLQTLLDKTNLDDYDFVDGSWVNKSTGEHLITDSIVSANYDDFIDRFGLRNNRNSKRYFKSFKAGYMDYINGMVGQLKQTSTKNDLTDQRVEGIKNVGLFGEGSSVNGINTLMKPIIPMVKESYQKAFELQMLQYRFDTLYYRTKNALTLANSENARNQYGFEYYQSLDPSAAAFGENLSNEVRNQYLDEAKNRNFGKIKAEIEQLQLDTEKIVSEFNKNLADYNKRITTSLGDYDEHPFRVYLMQSLIGNIQGNIFQSINSWQHNMLDKLGKFSNIVSPFVSAPTETGIPYSNVSF